MSLLEVVVGLFIIGVAAGSAFSVAAMEQGTAVRAATVVEVNALAELTLNEYVVLRRAPSPDDSSFRRFPPPFQNMERRAVGRTVGRGGDLVEVSIEVRSGPAVRELTTLIRLSGSE